MEIISLRQRIRLNISQSFMLNPKGAAITNPEDTETVLIIHGPLQLALKLLCAVKRPDDRCTAQLSSADSHMTCLFIEASKESGFGKSAEALDVSVRGLAPGNYEIVYRQYHSNLGVEKDS